MVLLKLSIVLDIIEPKACLLNPQDKTVVVFILRGERKGLREAKWCSKGTTAGRGQSAGTGQSQLELFPDVAR